MNYDFVLGFIISFVLMGIYFYLSELIFLKNENEFLKNKLNKNVSYVVQV